MSSDEAEPINVLVVEDEAAMRFMLERALRLEGYRVHPARSAEEAKQVVATTSIDLVVSDLNLHRMGDQGGGVLALELRPVLKEGVRFVAFSGDPDLAADDPRFDAVVPKSAGLAGLLEALGG